MSFYYVAYTLFKQNLMRKIICFCCFLLFYHVIIRCIFHTLRYFFSFRMGNKIEQKKKTKQNVMPILPTAAMVRYVFGTATTKTNDSLFNVAFHLSADIRINGGTSAI